MTPRPSSNVLGALLIVVAASSFGVLGPIAALRGHASGISSLTLVTWRAGVGAIVVILFMAARAAVGRRLGRPWREIPRRDRYFISASAASPTRP